MHFILDIKALSIYKNKSAKQVYIENQFSYFGETPVYATENLTREGLDYGIGLCFSLAFPKFQADKPYKIFVHFFFFPH